jgi:hypothetical protein
MPQWPPRLAADQNEINHVADRADTRTDLFPKRSANPERLIFAPR